MSSEENGAAGHEENRVVDEATPGVHDGASGQENRQTDESTPLLNGSTRPTTGPQPETDAAPADEVTVLAPTTSTARLVLILGTVYIGVFLGAIDASIIATLSAPISSEFGSLSLLSWLATAYLIANAACQPLSGRLTDVFGRGPGLVFSNLTFALGNLICGLAQDEGTVIAGRVIAGIGGGGLMSIATFVGSDLVPLRKRGVVQGFGNIAYGSGAMLGGVFGGLVNDRSSWGWRLAFLVQIPVVVVSAVLVLFLVKIPPNKSDRSYLARIDFGGAFLIVAFLLLLLLGLNAGGNLVPWSHPLVLASMPLSAAALAAFVWWEARTRLPIIPVGLLLHRTVLAACAANFVCTMVVLTAVFYVPLYMQVLGATPTQAALRILGSPLGVSVASVAAGLAMRRTGHYVGLAVLAVCVLAAGVVLLATLDEASWTWLPFVAMVLVGAGYGAMLTTTLLACIAAVDHAHQAVITSATYAFRSVGSTVGIALSSAVYQNVLAAGLWHRFGHLPGAADHIGRIRNDLGYLDHLPGGWKDGVISSFMDAFRAVWRTNLALAILGLIAVSLMKHHTLHSNLARED